MLTSRQGKGARGWQDAEPMIDRPLRNVALLVAACFFMENLDGTIVVTAIPKISDSLHVDAGSTGLVVTAYLVTLAVLIPLSGWMVARFGPRKVFLSAIVLFTLASAGCAAATNLGELIAMRILQGAGGAMMVPVGRMVVFERADKSQLMRVMSYIVWPGLVAPVIAPLAGGIITTYASWRWLFLINLPLGIVALAFAWRLIEDRPQPAPRPLDRIGVLLTCTGLAGLTYTAHLVSGGAPRWGWIAALTVASGVLLTTATVHLLRAESPLVELRTLRIPSFGRAISGSSIFLLVISAVPFLLTLLFQTVFGWSAIKSGAVVLFVFAGNIGIKPATTYLYNRFGFRRMLLVSTVALAATVAACGLITAGTPLVVIALIVLLSGVARSVGMTGYSTLALSDVPPEQMRDANAVSATAFQLFSGLGVAVAAIALRAGAPLGDLLPGVASERTAYVIAFAVMGLIALVSGAQAWRLHPAAGAAVMDRAR
jgi:EmrB/QacA subfamily drug resistance transporter